MRNQESHSLASQARTPYWDALRSTAPQLTVRTQAPGHNGKLPAEFQELLGENFALYDVSVVKGLDVPLPGQVSALVEAERLAAEATGAESVQFVTTGASGPAGGIASALVQIEQEREENSRRILVARNAHISVIHAFSRGRARVEFLPVEVHPQLGMGTVLDPAILEAALDEGDVGAVWVTTPCYEGVLGDVETYVSLAHDHGVPIVVDNAWGSEMPFSDRLGPSPLELGADAVIGSPHKVEAAPGQCAWVYLGKDSLFSDTDKDILNQSILAYKTTSKSSVFLAALDLCRWWAHFNADAGIQANLRAVEECREWLPEGILVDWNQERRAGRTLAPSNIPYRMTLATWKLGYTGYDVARLLEARGVQVAQANLRYLFMGAGVGHPETIRAAVGTFASVMETLEERRPLDLDSLPNLVLQRATVDFGTVPRGVELVELRDAVGRKLAHPLGAYPPGFAIRTKTETLDEDTYRYLATVRANGGTLFGGNPETLGRGMVRVYK